MIESLKELSAEELNNIDKSNWSEMNLKWFDGWNQQLADVLNSQIPDNLKADKEQLKILRNLHYFAFVTGYKTGKINGIKECTDGLGKYDIRKGVV